MHISGENISYKKDVELYSKSLCYTYSSRKVKVKQTLYRPGQALKVLGEWGSQIVTPRPLPLLPLRKYFWHLFPSETESTPGPNCSRKDYINKKLQLPHRESNPRPSGLKRSASPNRATACPGIFTYCKQIVSPTFTRYVYSNTKEAKLQV